MADFSVPFGKESERRLPTVTERLLGFPCGPANQLLFNGLFHRVESEIGEVISFAGLDATDDRFTQLREAIEALISAATGGGDTSQFLLISQARSRLPIYPEFLTGDGKINTASPATGTIRLPGGITFLHRGIFPITTTETDFPSDVSKIYHLRWSSTSGYELKDLSDSEYNPSAYSEGSDFFDSDYDNMLISRVVTNSSNVATITNLINKHRINTSIARAPTVGDAGASGVISDFAIDFSRTPLCMLKNIQPPGTYRDSDLRIELLSEDRYNVQVRSWVWTDTVVTNHNSPGYRYNILAV